MWSSDEGLASGGGRGLHMREGPSGGGRGHQMREGSTYEEGANR